MSDFSFDKIGNANLVEHYRKPCNEITSKSSGNGV